MTVNITDVDAFTDPVVAPDDTDPATGASVQQPVQALANRTRNLKNRLDDQDALAGDLATFTIEASALANDGELTITEVLDPSDSFSVASDEITVPSAGWYRFDLSGRISSTDATDNLDFTLSLELAGTGTVYAPRARRCTTSDVSVPFSISGLVEVTDVAHTFTVTNKSGIAVSVSGGVMCLQRIS